MIELSKKMFNEKDISDFENIIWVSAKKDYYNPLLDIKENMKIEFKTFEQILDSIFIFMEFSDFVDLKVEDKKSLFFDILKDNSILLIIDNLETVNKVEVQK